MNSTERVYITGAGIISALGNGIEVTSRAISQGRSGIESVKYLHTSHRELPVGEVKESNEELSARLQVKGEASQIRNVLLGVSALREAVASASLSASDLKNTAFINGTTVGGMDLTEQYFKAVYDSGGKDENSISVRYNDCGISTEMIASEVGEFAMITTSSTACSSGANAIILGAEMIKAGIIDRVIAGGTESLSNFHFNGFKTLMILDNDKCRPFDRDRKGINLGEGAAYIVLESERACKARGVKPLGILSGYGNRCDAFHQTATSDDGEGPYQSMTAALQMASLRPEEIDYISAHGTGTPNNDMTELAAMKRIWGDKLPYFSSTKAMTGHTTSASGAIETVMSLIILNEGIIPPALGVINPIEQGAMPVVEPLKAEGIKNIVNNSFGFGGNDSTLIISKSSI